MNLDEVKIKYPAYANVPDDVLAKKLHAKFYAHVPFYQFAEKVGYTGYDREVGERVGRGNQPSALDTTLSNVGSAIEQKVVGPLEAVATGASRAIVGGMGGAGAELIARATGGDPAEARAAVEPYVVKPRTPTGKAIVADVNEKIGKVAAPVGEAVLDIDADIGTHLGPQAQEFARELAGTAGNILDLTPLAPVVSRGLTLAKQAATPLKQTADTLIERARAAGLRVRPSDVDARQFAGETPSGASRVGEWWGGSEELQKSFIIHNKPIYNSIVAEDAGLPKNSPMGPTELARLREPELKVYETLRNELQPVAMDDEIIRAVSGVDRGSESLLPMPPSLGRLQQAILAKEQVSAGNLIDTISDLRRQGFKGAASENPDIADLGLAQVRLADQLEKQLDAMVARQKPSMVGAYQASRQKLAKINTLEATNVAGEVDPAALARLNRKTERGVLSGGQLLVADMGEAFPKVVTMKMPDPKPPPSAGAVLANTVLLGAIPATRAGARGLMRATRGEAKVPQTGLGRALAEYYKGDINEGRGALKLDRPAGTVGEGSRQDGFNFTEPTDIEAAGAPFEGVAPVRGGGPDVGRAPQAGPPAPLSVQQLAMDERARLETGDPASRGAPQGLPLATGAASINRPGVRTTELPGPFPGNPGVWPDAGSPPGLSRTVGRQDPRATTATPTADQMTPPGATATTGATAPTSERTARLVRTMAAQSNIPPAQRWAKAKELEAGIDRWQSKRGLVPMGEQRALAQALRAATGEQGAWYSNAKINEAIRNLKTREVQAEAKRLSGNLGVRK